MIQTKEEEKHQKQSKGITKIPWPEIDTMSLRAMSK